MCSNKTENNFHYNSPRVLSKLDNIKYEEEDASN